MKAIIDEELQKIYENKCISRSYLHVNIACQYALENFAVSIPTVPKIN